MNCLAFYFQPNRSVSTLLLGIHRRLSNGDLPSGKRIWNMTSWKFPDLQEETHQRRSFHYMLQKDSHSNMGVVMILLHLWKRLKILFQCNSETKFLEGNWWFHHHHLKPEFQLFQLNLFFSFKSFQKGSGEITHNPLPLVVWKGKKSTKTSRPVGPPLTSTIPLIHLGDLNPCPISGSPVALLTIEICKSPQQLRWRTFCSISWNPKIRVLD